MTREIALSMLEEYACLAEGESDVLFKINERFPADGSINKAMRWLGFCQGVLLQRGVFTLDELKAQSMTGEVPLSQTRQPEQKVEAEVSTDVLKKLFQVARYRALDLLIPYDVELIEEVKAVLATKQGAPQDVAGGTEGLIEMLQQARQEIYLAHSKDGAVYDPTILIRIDAALSPTLAGEQKEEA